MIVKIYQDNLKSVWDEFISRAKNSHFIFYRDYLEYHKDRYKDFSLMIYDENHNLVSVFPANIKDDVLYSHQGLTFGGFLIDDRMRTETMLEIFETLKSYLLKIELKKVVYKCIPYIYHIKPAEEDRYALFRNSAQLIRRDVTSTINLSQIRYSKGRKWSINKAKKENVEASETDDYKTFWDLLTTVLLDNHGVNPVHSLAEMKKLAASFPEHIRLFRAYKGQDTLAGALIYENQNIVHTQYLANSAVGREIGALDFLLDYLIKTVFKDKQYFDFGISNEDSGKYLNTGLISQKEGFGASAVAHDFYELVLQ